MISLSPVLASWLQPVIVPVYTFFGADAAMFAPTILAPDSGGYAIAMELASNQLVAAWAGTVVAAHLGSTISFNIPITLGIIEREDFRFFSLGALSGLISCPFGCILGGVLAKLPLKVVLINMIPALIVSVILCLGLLLVPNVFIRTLVFLGRMLTFVILIGLTLAVIERLTGIVILPGMNPLSTGLSVAGNVVSTLAGIFVLTYVVTRVFRRQLQNLSRLLGINEIAILGIINSFAAIIPGCSTFKDMDTRGKVLFAAATASCSNILGAHLGFIGTTVPTMLMPSVVGKFFSGAIAFAIAMLLAKRILATGQKEESAVSASVPPT
jgi:ethanolamine transporter